MVTNVPISSLPVASTPLTGAELVPLDQGLVTKQTTVAAFATETLSSITSLPAASSLTGSEVALVAQGGSSKQTTTAAIAALATFPGSETVATFATLSAAQAANVPGAVSGVQLLGYSSAGDGGGAFYAKASAGAGSGKFQSADGQWWIISQTVRNLLMFGGNGNGSADNHAALLAAASFGPFWITAGSSGTNFAVASSTSINALVLMDGSATLQPATGQTITFAGGFSAPVAQAFKNALASQGMIAFNTALFNTGYPEWWGAVCYSTTQGSPTDSLAAITACIVACPVSQFQAGIYYTTNTLIVLNTARTMIGVGGDADGTSPQTAIFMNGQATATIFRIGPASQPVPNSSSGFIGFVNVFNMTFIRATAPTPPGSGFIGTFGVALQWAETCNLNNVWTSENSSGFYVTGTVTCRLSNCHSFRDLLGTTSTNDFYCGFLLDFSPNIGFNSGNASLYIDQKSGVTKNFTLAGSNVSYGIYTIGGFTDLFIDKFETSQIAEGATFNGTSGSVTYAAEDLKVTNSTFDSCSLSGIVINGAANTNVAVTITNNYCAPVRNDATACYGIQVTGTTGAITIANNQIISNSASTGAQGINIVNSNGGVSIGNIITDVQLPISLNTATGWRSSDIINVDTASGVTGTNAVLLAACTRCLVEPTLRGGSSRFTNGVNLNSTGNTFIEARMTTVDPAVVGASNKLVANGTQITSAGTFNGGGGSNCLAQGIMN